jgi:hypothetical protein
LEVAKDLFKNGDRSLKGRLNTFIANLWLRGGQLKEAEELEAETLKLISGDLEKVGAANLGMAFIVRAEILATKGDWKEADEVFEQSMQIFKNSRYGLYFEALAQAWYGETLTGTGRPEDGGNILIRAREIYQRMNNDSQVSKINAIITNCKCDGRKST